MGARDSRADSVLSAPDPSAAVRVPASSSTKSKSKPVIHQHSKPAPKEHCSTSVMDKDHWR